MLPVNHTGGIRDAGGISRHQGCCVGNRQPSCATRARPTT